MVWNALKDIQVSTINKSKFGKLAYRQDGEKVNNMEREECQKQIRELMIQIRDVYRKYNPDGNYLAMFIEGDHLMVNNAYWEDDIDRPLDKFYVIKLTD